METQTPVSSTPIPDTPVAKPNPQGWLAVALRFDEEGNYEGRNNIALFPTSFEAANFLEEQKHRGLYHDAPGVVHAIIKNGTIIGKGNRIFKS